MKKLEEMTADELVAARDALMRGSLTYASPPNGWFPAASLQVGTTYRVKERKPSVDWSHVGPEFNAIVQTEGGYILIFHRPPVPTRGAEGFAWILGDDNFNRVVGKVGQACALASYDPGTVAPEDSLIIRPGADI